MVKQCRYGWFCGKCPLSNFIVWVGNGGPKDCERPGHQKEGGIDPLGSYRVLRRRVGAKGTQNSPFSVEEDGIKSEPENGHNRL